MTSQELIRVIKEEYTRRLRRAGKLSKEETTQQLTNGKPSLLGQLNTNTEHCGHCGYRVTLFHTLSSFGIMTHFFSIFTSNII